MTAGLTTLFPDTHSPQWRIDAFHLVNWGGYDGYHRIELSPGSNLISGPSGVGKSTLMDAYTALVMPSDVAFNGASNAGQGRARSASQRNVVSYVRGKLDSVQNADGEMMDRRLRAIDDRGKVCSAASVVAVTFRKDDGDYFTAARLFYVKATVSSDGELGNPVRLVISSTLDVKALYDEFVGTVGHQGYQRRLESTFPGSKVYDTYSAFLTAAQSTLQIGKRGEAGKALKLLSRIQAGEQQSTIDAMYKKLVFEQPTTFDAAKDALDQYAETVRTYEQMQTSYDQIEVLDGIEDRYARYESAVEQAINLGALRHRQPGDTPWLLWHSSVGDVEYGAALQLADAEAVVAGMELAEATAAAEDAEVKVSGLERQIREEGGDRLARIAEDLKAWDKTLRTRQGEQVAFQIHANTLGVEPPVSSAALAALHERAAAFLASFDQQQENLREQANAAGLAALDAKRTWERTKADLEDARMRPNSRIPGYLNDRREALAALCNIADAQRDLPFVGELIDLHDDDERWRAAAEAEMGGFGKCILVNESIRAEFVRHADSLPAGVRLRSESVPIDMDPPAATPNPSMLAGKVRYKPGSPFTGWLAGHINAAFTHECVEDVDALLINDGRKRITVRGQTRQGRSGAHGAPRPESYVLGFNNADRIAALEREVSILAAERNETGQRADKLQGTLNRLHDNQRAWENIRDTPWEDIDTGSAERAISTLEAERDAFLAAEDKIAELESKLEAAKTDRESTQRAKYQAEQRTQHLNERIERLRPLATHAGARHADLETAGVTLTPTQQTMLDDMLGDVYDGNSDTLPRAMGKVQDAVDRRIATSAEESTQSRRSLEDMFKRFKSKWVNYDLGTDVSSYPDYHQHYEQLITSDLARHRDDFLSDVSEWTGHQLALLTSEFEGQSCHIKERLHDVNAILAEIPFGRDGDRLRIDPTERATPASRHFWDSVQAFADSTSRAQTVTLEVARDRFHTISQFIRQIMPPDQLGPGEISPREEILDVRRHITLKAQKIDAETGEIKGTYAEFDAKSGGEMQEMVAFIVGAALRYQLGDEQHARPTFAPVILDEAFIKADAQFAARAVNAWVQLGFQLIAGSVAEKVAAFTQKVDRVVLINKDDDGYSTASLFIGDTPIPVTV